STWNKQDLNICEHFTVSDYKDIVCWRSSHNLRDSQFGGEMSDEETEATTSNANTAVEELVVEEADVSFKDLGLTDALIEACEKLNWKKPSKIQREAIPVALQGKDVIGLAETG
ncbi:unnamed protein product, partial [Allacma fusca]